ncbi:tetratricopeptide repeat protein [Flavobacterium ponti]|jgi:signal transduction histidine kinase|uniref:histidine kinase n=1 Tax=Flavobacterium ponti TaxID=665133 RepID=A0ABV9P2P8_9FLAO
MNISFKKIFFLIIILSFYFCNNKKNYDTISHNINDSIVYYNDNIKNLSISDSLKKSLNDKVFKLNKLNTNDSIRIKNNDTIAYNYFRLNYFDDYNKVVKYNYSESLKLRDTSRIIKSTINYGHYYLRRNFYDSAFYYFDKSQKLYIANNEVDKSNELAIEKATIQYYKGDYLGSETTILKSLSFFKKKNDNFKLNAAYTIIGLCKMDLKEYDESIEYLNLALDLSKKINANNSTDPILLNNIGLVYFKKGDYKKAIEYYLQIINNTEVKTSNFQVYTFAKQFLTYSKFKLGDIKNFESEYNEVIKNYKNLNISLVQPYVQLSEIYEEKKDINKAQKLATEAYNISIKDNLFRDKLLAIKQLANVFPDKAKYYSDEYVKLNDSIATLDKKIQNTFARIEYRVDELNNENLLLAERNKQLIYYSVIGVLLLSMFYFYRWQKQKQKELLLVQEQQQANEEVYNMMINQQNQMDFVKAQEQKRISQELHDAILGKLFGARMNLDFLNNNESEEIKKEKEKYIQEIIQVEKQIRQISHELNDDQRTIINNYQMMIDKLVEEQETLLNLKIDYVFNEKIPWEKLTAEEKINLYRIFQETFHNINKYAKAKKVIFSFTLDFNKLKISILDDGIGFDAKRIAKGIGIKNMKERAKLINAIYTIESEINKGTRTQIILEINPNKEF